MPKRGRELTADDVAAMKVLEILTTDELGCRQLCAARLNLATG